MGVTAKKRVKWFLIALAAAMVLAHPLALWMIADCRFFETVNGHIRQSERIRAQVGQVVEIRLAFFARTNINVGIHLAYANYTLVVIGTRDRMRVAVSVSGEGEQFRIRAIRADTGEAIPLPEMVSPQRHEPLNPPT